MNKGKTKISVIISSIILMLVLVINIGLTFAWYTDHKDYSNNIDFGYIKIDVNNSETDGYFSNTDNYYNSIKPGDYLLRKDVKFNLRSGSDPAYVRAKYEVSIDKANSTYTQDETNVYNYLKYRDFTLGANSSEYHWSEKHGDYYYLLGSDNLPIAIDKTTDGYYTFLTKDNSQIDYSLDYDATNVNKSGIKVNITIEAIQVPSVTKTIDGVETALNELNGFTKPTDNYSVTFVYGENQTAVTSSVTYGASASLPSAVTSLVSKGFSLWNGGLKIIGENGYNHSYIKDNKICNITENLTLYEASEITLFNVTFKNGTETLQTNKVISGKYAEYLGNKPTKTASDKVYTFAGWSKTANGEVVDLTTEKITQDTTFYAIFTEKTATYRINFNLAGGRFTTTPTTIISPTDNITLPTNEDVYKEGYTLEGWYLDGAFTNKVTQLTGITNDITLYAKWVMATCGVETTSGKLYFDNLDDAFTYALTNNDSKVIIYKTNEEDCKIELPLTIPTGKTLTIVSNGVMSNIGVHANIINNGTLIIGGKTNSLNNLTFVIYDECGIENSGNLTIYGGNFNRKGSGKSLITTTGGNLKVLGGTFEDLVVDSTNSFIKLANTVANISDATMKNENTSSQTMIEVTENSVVTFDGETKLLNPYGYLIDTSTGSAQSFVTININDGEYNGAIFVRTNNIFNYNNGLIKQTNVENAIITRGTFNMNGGTILTQFAEDFNFDANASYYSILAQNGTVNLKGGVIKFVNNNFEGMSFYNLQASNNCNVIVDYISMQNEVSVTTRVRGIDLLDSAILIFNHGEIALNGEFAYASRAIMSMSRGVKITINDGTFTGYWRSVIAPITAESLNITGGNYYTEKEGGSVIDVFGTVNISGGVFTSKSGHVISIGEDANLTITDGTFTSGSDTTNKLAVMFINTAVTNVNVNINGGTYNGDYILLNEDATSVYNAKINKGVLTAKNNAIYLVGSGATTTLNGGIIKTTNTENANAIYIENGALILNNASITGNIYYETKDKLITVNGKLNGSYVINFKEGLFSLGDEVIKFSNGISATTYKNNFSLIESMSNYLLYPNTTDDSLCLSQYFTVTFANDDGTVLKTEKVAYGDVPTYNGATPTKESDEMYVYTFSGWNQEFSKVTENITYYAQYSVEPYYVTLPEATAFKNALTSSCGFNYNAITSLTFSNSAPAGYTKGTTQITSGIDVYYNSDKAVVLVTKGGILAPTNSGSLFSGFYALKDIKFNGILSTKNVTNMGDMFYANPLLEELDLSSFETNNLQSFSEMFEGCEKLKSVNLSNFILPSDVSDNMFSFCYELETVYAPKAIGANTSIGLGYGAGFWGVEGTNTTITSLTKEVAGKKIVVSGYVLTKDWQSQITWTEVGELTNGVKSITEISFERTAPTGYSNSGKKINNIEVYANGTKIAFVSAKNIMAPKDSSYLFSNSSSTYQLTNLTSISFNNFDTSNTTNMFGMFYNCSGLTSLDLSTFNTSKVTNMQSMFMNCSSLTSINLTGSFDTSKVTNMGMMFVGCSSLTALDLSNFNTSKVSAFAVMFSGCSSLTQIDISNFDFSNANAFNALFQGCSSLTSIKADWSTSTKKVTSLYNMFGDCESLKQIDLRNLNTSGVTSFEYMFQNCSSLQDLDLSNFVISSSSTVTDMLTGATNIVRIIAPNSIGKAITLPGTYYINGTGTGVPSITTSDAGKIFVKQKEILSFVNLPTVADLQAVINNNFTTRWISLTEIGFYYTKDIPTGYTKNTTLTSSLNISGINIYTSGTKIAFVSDFTMKAPTSCAEMFAGCASLTTLDLSNFDTSKVTNMVSMFHCCDVLTRLDLSGFDTSKVTDMSFMFSQDYEMDGGNLSEIIFGKNFKTSNVTNMEGMFRFCEKLTRLNLSGFDTSKVTNMSYMFHYCYKLTSLNLSSFDTSKVTSWSSMFYNSFVSANTSVLTISDKFVIDGSNTFTKATLNSKTSFNTTVTLKRGSTTVS